MKKLDKFLRWLRWDAKHLHRDIANAIQKLWYWFPIIIKDRDWDQFYIYEVLKHKLKAQAKYIASKDRHTRAQSDARKMLLCAKLIEICQEGTYEIEYMDYCETSFSWEDIEGDEKTYRLETDQISEDFDSYFKKYKLVYKRVLKGEGIFPLDGKDQADIKKRIAMNISHLNQDRARKLLFKVMESSIEGWWD